MEYDIAGAGPAGLAAALWLKQQAAQAGRDHGPARLERADCGLAGAPHRAPEGGGGPNYRNI